MKSLFQLILIGCTSISFAQTRDLVQHNGSKIEVNYIKTANDIVYYSSANSSEEKAISKFAVAQIQENDKSSSKTISEKVNITGAADFEKVRVISTQQTIGLKNMGTISSFLGKTKGDTDQAFKDQALKRLQQLAAEKNAPFIVITSNKSQNLKAELYGY